MHKANQEMLNTIYAKSQEEINKLIKEKQKFYELNHQLEKDLEVTKEKFKHSTNQAEYFAQQSKSVQGQLLDYREYIGMLETKLSLLNSEKEDKNPDIKLK
jgi:chromosome segregation ATPase